MDSRLQRGESSRERRIPEEAMIAKFIGNANTPRAMYDLGVGCFYEFRTLKILYPDMQVFGCEPCPTDYLALLPIFVGDLLPIAISAEGGKRTFHVSPISGGSSFYQTVGETRETIEVDVWTLDKFDEWAGKPRKVLLWMDIEGSELDALRGGTELLKSGRVEWVNVETRDVHATCLAGHPTTAEVTTFLREYGYKPVLRYNVQGAYPEAPGDVIYFREDIEPCRKGNM